ncbi:MAG: phospholipase D/Transphosphatidylase [Myxococcaceae bacterium]|nr:phospholipase D/Transphosphatidylase [Myxococcaceae bacterium]
MRYRRALLLVERPEDDARAALWALRRVAPSLERLVVVVVRAAPFSLAWLTGEPPADGESPAAVEALRAQAALAAPSVEVHPVSELSVKALTQLATAEALDLLVVSTRTLRTLAAVNELRRSVGITVLFAGAGGDGGAIDRVTCFAESHRGRAVIRPFLRDHLDAAMRVTLLAPPARSRPALASILEVAGIHARVEDGPPGPRSLREVLETAGAEPAAQLLVVARIPATALLGAPWPVPVLWLPPEASPRPFTQRAIDLADLLDDGGPLRVRVHHLATVGDLSPIADQELSFVTGGRVVATLATHDGEGQLPPGLAASALGVFRARAEPVDPVTAIEQQVGVVRAGPRPVILFDATVADEVLRVLAQLEGPPAPELLAVRLRPSVSCRSVRARLRALGLVPRVLDARAVLDEGPALDVSAVNDPVRLARVAARLRQAGFAVAGILHRGLVHPEVHGFATLSEPELVAGAPVVLGPALPPPLPAVTPPIAGNRIALELDNALARRWLVDAITHACESIHFQVYMVLDDDVGAPVEAALAEAGARGVKVRVLVDSLHGLHGSFGAKNPLLERLAARPGVELRVLRPITEVPSLSDLKQRDHRKLTVVDGALALLGGRNLSHEYYTGFGEVPLTPTSTWRAVPWLDAGARVEGPAVGALAAGFLEAWVGAGGEPFPLFTPPALGTTTARVITHRGLRDAHTLETYRQLIDSATSHLNVVNGFPLVLELQHALLQAIRRGVRVRVLSGHATPTHDGQPFKGPWATARAAATELVQSRLDPLVAAGGEAWTFAIHPLPGWAPGVGVVQPHVHAKLLTVDGQRCAVGSANLDITAAYWESELMLLVEDAALVRDCEAQIDARLAHSVRVDPGDPTWKQRAQRREWMRHWPGVLSV